METRPETENIEARLLASAPMPPPELRRQVLQRCREARRSKPDFTWGVRWRLSGALMVFLLLCGFANSRLDAQNLAILSGENGQQIHTALSLPIPGLPQLDPQGQSLIVVIRWRIHQIALLLDEKYSG